MEKTIKDFGMKIEGARKNRDKKKQEKIIPELKNPGNILLICRDNIWPETNGEKLIASGIPQGVAYWREEIRKAIPSHPANADEVSMINYFNTVSELRDQVNQVNDAAGVDSFFHYLQQNYLSISNHQDMDVAGSAKDVISKKLLRIAKINYPVYENKAEKLLFGIPKKDRAAVRKKQKERKQNGNRDNDSPYEHRKKPFPLPKLSSFIRNGSSYLPEGCHAGENEFLSLGIRGVEFGLWMSDKDAQSALDQCYHALCDLAYVLDIAPDDISLGGKLALSFGARGYGEVLADYKAEQQLISLPNGNGNGFLAHAWFYAMDEYFEQRFGKSFSQMAELALWNSYTYPAPSFVKEFQQCLMYRNVMITTNEQNDILEQKHQAAIQKSEIYLWKKLQSIMTKPLTSEQQIRWDNALQEVYEHRCIAKQDMYFGVNGTNPALEKLSALHKEITGHVIPRRKRISINAALANLHLAEQPYRRAMKDIEQIINTDYQDGCWELYRNFAKTPHGEHYDLCEKFARAFDCYIADKLREAGIENQYLTAHSEEFVFQYESGRVVYAIPMGEERKKLNQQFDQLILKMKELGLFHHRNEQENSMTINKENALKDTRKTSIADIRSMVAESRENTEFRCENTANSYNGRYMR